ncbi:ATP-binding protein [Cellulophaga baltica]|uniref:ATP-binding protein n=1 Tax=Cellulophaga baltica TaxID=76594 RepID=UPI0015F3DE6A|nr:ATP-binding protein [Cellulophaga baltica]MBA6316953.1 ATP-binding protein [Cellulophaga baltica]
MKHETEILRLLESKREGDYWDFKQEPHENKASLLHDILCLANCSHRGNRFLIYGVTDPDEGTEIIGLSKGHKNRKSQVQFIDFLRSKPFAGDCRPEIELHTLLINGLEIDILVIFDKPLKPYYLSQDYRDNGKIVKANFIYTRTNDTNTPIDKSADIGVIEKMWRQRFGLDISPLERMKMLLLQPQDWFKDIGNKPYAYHLDFPEFRIEFSEVHEFWEVFSSFFTNEKSYLGTATFKYHSTTLFELEYMYCDEMRIEFAVPKTAIVRLKNYNNWFYYYNLEALNGIFLQFMTNNLSHIYSRNNAFPFVIFDNETERDTFIDYVTKNENLLDEIKPDLWGEMAKDNMKKEKKGSVIDPIFIDKVIQLHEKWAGHNTR